MNRAVTGPLPARYATWMDQLFSGPVPSEPKATCHDCAMCVPGTTPTPGDSPKDAVFYDPDVKCCSYTPVLWNFLVGDLLADRSPEAATGRASVEQRIAAGVAVSPMGLDRPPTYFALYQHISKAFGRTQAMRCPHYIEEGGLCGVWRHRESTCVTWFCKHERGAVGKTFWNRLHQLLQTVERCLAQWSVIQLGLDVGTLGNLFPPLGTPSSATPVTGSDFDGRADPDRQRRMWGTWLGREREFYGAAADVVRTIDWETIERIGGPELRIYAEVTRKAYDDLVSEKLPERVRLRSLDLSAAGPEAYQLATYSPLDPLHLPSELVEVLQYFDGQPTREAMDQIARERGLKLSAGLVRKLTDFQVLSAVD